MRKGKRVQLELCTSDWCVCNIEKKTYKIWFSFGFVLLFHLVRRNMVFLVVFGKSPYWESSWEFFYYVSLYVWVSACVLWSVCVFVSWFQVWFDKIRQEWNGIFRLLFFCFVLLITFIYLVPIIFVLYNIIDYAFLLAKPAAATESSALHSTNGVSNNNKRGEWESFE